MFDRLEVITPTDSIAPAYKFYQAKGLEG